MKITASLKEFTVYDSREESLGFGLLIRQKKQSEDITLAPGLLVWSCLWTGQQIDFL